MAEPLDSAVAHLWAGLDARHDELIAVIADLVQRPSLLGGKGQRRPTLPTICTDPAWIHDPWAAQIIGDRMYGQGARGHGGCACCCQRDVIRSNNG